MRKTYFSTRVYKNTLPEKYNDSISHTLLLFSRSKHFAFQTQVLEKRSSESKREKSLHLTVKERFQLNDHYAGSAIQEANALIKSQNELKKMYIENKEVQITSVKKKMKSTKWHLTTLLKIKQSFVNGIPKFNQTSREQQVGHFFVVKFKFRSDIYYHAYQFEHVYLDVQIAHFKNRLGRLEFRIDRLQKQIRSLKNNSNSVVFGTKKLFKAQHTIENYQNDHQQWRKDWEQARYHQMTIIGRKDAKVGNFVFCYIPETRELNFKTTNGTQIKIENLAFPHGQEQVNHAIETQMNCKNKKKYGKPIAWSVEDHGDYYIFKCIVDVPENPHKNHSRADGLLGLDLNVDHIAWSNINAKGQLIKSGVFSFGLEGKTSEQITKIIENKAVVIVDLAMKLNKPIALEKLNTTQSKGSHPYGNRKANKAMSQFAYNKMISAIKNRAEKMGVAVFDVNSAYTSQIGKIKYMKRLGISIHQAASYVIARRAMGFKETLPPVLHSLLPEKIAGLHHWAQWKWVSSCLSDVRKHAFYRIELFACDKIDSMNQLFPQGALSDLEAKGLSKVRSRKPIA
ncbi:IS200/IS605 family accessory protein TnpB-related protein [Bacillaceae bacterium CLA-AA-H227]|uniref:IS200/IS605 family accessory protein TnpB-related protein n=1 Tax=Robertmurraya yapensis (ex Hitch et al 2024) TaxID=3133160 RepID=A0ACC6S599_9BACI|nr:IS200/IS605 family accessory protein TnpB-related protein [Bacillus yapensis]